MGSGGTGYVSYCNHRTWSSLIRQTSFWIPRLTPVHLFACYLIGIRPVAVEDRTETNFINIFFLWFSANTNILACVCPFTSLLCNAKLYDFGTFHRFASGTLGPVTFGLGLRDSCLVILIFNLLSAIPPAYL